MRPRYGIAEWYGEPLLQMSSNRRQELAGIALGSEPDPPICPFQPRSVPCSKKGGVCSIQQYDLQTGPDGYRIEKPFGTPIITCPHRFRQGNLIVKWLAKIVGFSEDDSYVASEVPFMRSPTTGRSAGRIDLVLASTSTEKYFGLEIQAVYFSGKGMGADFEALAEDSGELPPAPSAIRRPDWRSSSAKRLMPQLQIKAPTLRRWGTKLAVSVDRNFFADLGGPSNNPVHDLDEGDIIWLVPSISGKYQLERFHWEVLSLEDSCDKLLSAKTVKRSEFEDALRAKLQML